MAVYLIHLDTPLAHARHYCGFAEDDVQARFARHQAGNGARMLAVALERGITFQLVREWPEGDRKLERRFKKGSLTSLCPLCRPARLARQRETSKALRQCRKAAARREAECPF